MGTANKYMKYYILLIALIFITGCTFLRGFGEDVIKINVKTEKESPTEAIAIKNVETIPRSPVLPGQNVMLFFTIENRDNTKEAKNVMVELFNPASFMVVKDGTQDVGRILPGEQRQVQISLRAPSEQDIAGVKLETDLHFRVIYDFESSTIMQALIVNEAEILARQRQGQPVPLESNIIMGSGPVKVESNIIGVSYILAGQPQGGIIVMKVVNSGDKTKGDVKDGTISAGNLKIEFPAGLGNVKCPEMGSSGSSSPGSPGTPPSPGCTANFPNLINGKCCAYSNVRCGGHDQSGSTPYAGSAGCNKAYEDVYRCSDGNFEFIRSPPADSECRTCSWCTKGDGDCPVDCSVFKNINDCFNAGCSWYQGGTPNARCDKRSLSGTNSDVGNKISLAATKITGIVSAQAAGGTCTNSNDIELFKGESTPFRFDVDSSGIRLAEPFRTHSIKVSVSYTYELRGSVHIVVNPLQNV